MVKNEPLDKELYEKLKKEIWAQYKLPSAYRSAQLVRKYKEAGGTYSGEKIKMKELHAGLEKHGPINAEKQDMIRSPISTDPPLELQKTPPQLLLN